MRLLIATQFYTTNQLASGGKGGRLEAPTDPQTERGRVVGQLGRARLARTPRAKASSLNASSLKAKANGLTTLPFLRPPPFSIPCFERRACLQNNNKAFDAEARHHLCSCVGLVPNFFRTTTALERNTQRGKLRGNWLALLVLFPCTVHLSKLYGQDSHTTRGVGVARYVAPEAHISRPDPHPPGGGTARGSKRLSSMYHRTHMSVIQL